MPSVSGWRLQGMTADAAIALIRDFLCPPYRAGVYSALVRGPMINHRQGFYALRFGLAFTDGNTGGNGYFLVVFLCPPYRAGVYSANLKHRTCYRVAVSMPSVSGWRLQR